MSRARGEGEEGRGCRGLGEKVRRGEDVEDWGEGRECRGLGGR